MPRRILVTGAAGFVGSHLCHVLALAFPDAVIAASRFDVTDYPAMLADIAADPPDACVHLAAIAAIPSAQRDPDRAWRVNLHGTLGLARALMEAAPHCTLLFPSSADAYGRGFQSGTPVTEATALAPMNTYGATKAAADLALGAMAGLRIIRVRPFNHTGPGQSADFVVASFARQVARIEAGLQPPVLQVGDLNPFRDFLHVRDVCAAYALCLAQAEALPPNTILNIASGTVHRVGDMLRDLLAIADVDAAIETDKARLRPSDIPVARGDASAARALLGWAPRIPWAQTLGETLDDWRGRVRNE